VAVACCDEQRFELGDFELAGGTVLPQAQLCYRTMGSLRPDRSNLVLVPTPYGAWAQDQTWLMGTIFDPARWCLVVVGQFGNGQSSSPSNTKGGLPYGGWPTGHVDNVHAQRRLLEEVFAVESPALIYGWSMGAQQAYHWGVIEPERSQRLCCICGTARTTAHNRLFLLSLRSALTTDPAWNGERFVAAPERGLHSFALIYASWAASQAFYRQGGHRRLGYATVDEYVERSWLPAYRRHDPHDLLAMLDVWLACDVARAAGLASGDEQADLAGALGRVRARTTVVACGQDLYFPPEDCAAEAALIPGARFETLASPLGHRAGNPRDSLPEQARLRQIVEQLCQD
jgi:homoserine O-acetyltransferase/O-succinyltransferase